MEDTRTVFSFDGLLGFVVAVVVLLMVLVFLMYFAIGSQNHNAQNYYDIKDAKSIKKFNSDSTKHVVDFKGV